MDTRDLRIVVSKESTDLSTSYFLYFAHSFLAFVSCIPRARSACFGVRFGLSATTAHTLRYTSSMPAALTSTSTSVPTSPLGGFRRLWRALKQLFHEMTGAIFAILAVAWLNNAFRAWTRDVLTGSSR